MAEVATRCGDVHRQQPGKRLTRITHATPALAENRKLMLRQFLSGAVAACNTEVLIAPPITPMPFLALNSRWRRSIDWLQCVSPDT